MKPSGQQLINNAKKYLGRPYILGVKVPKNNIPYLGAFDCAELVARVYFETTGLLYGCRDLHHDAYTGYFGLDAETIGVKVEVEDAARIPGAALLRLPTGDATGHIVLTQGTSETVEARGSKYGVVEYKVSGRDWDYGILFPGIDYSRNEPVKIEKPFGKLIKLVTPFLIDAAVGLIQKALKAKGLYHGAIDNQYGPKTQTAVVQFQKIAGLTPDGALVSGGDTAKALQVSF